MSGKDTGIRWVNGDRQGDLDFADNIALLENSWKGMKDLTDRTPKKKQESLSSTSTEKRQRSRKLEDGTKLKMKRS